MVEKLQNKIYGGRLIACALSGGYRKTERKHQNCQPLCERKSEDRLPLRKRQQEVN